MRLLFKELKKLFNPLIVLILAAFSIAYTFVFLSFPFSQRWTVRQTRLYEELRAEFGNELSSDEWDAFLAKREAVLERINERIRSSEILRKNGIDDYEAFIHTPPVVFTPTTSEAAIEMQMEKDRIFILDENTSPLFEYLSEMDYLISRKEDFHALADERDYDEAKGGGYVPSDAPHRNAAVAKRYRQTSTSSISLIPRTAAGNVRDGLMWLMILSAILCFVLILPCLIKERLRGMRDIQLASAAGRGIFALQAKTCALLGLGVGLLLDLVYALLLWRSGTLGFIACDISSFDRWRFWTDISFGSYLLIHALAVMLFSVCASLSAYFIGRLANSHIVGLGIALPVAAALVFGFYMLVRNPLYLFSSPSLAAAVIKICITLLIFAAISAAVLIMLKRDKVRDIL